MTTATPSRRHTSATLPTLAILLLLAVPVTFADSPLNMGEISVTSSLRQEFTVASGDVLMGFLSIANHGDALASVTITQADLSFDDGGAVAYEDANSSPSSNAAWIYVPSRIDVPADGQVQVPFTIEVPTAGMLPGSYWSVLRVQAEAATSVTTESRFDLVTTRVDVIVQYAVTILTHVGTPDVRTLQFEQPAFRQDPDTGGYRLHVVLHNPGEYVVSAKVWLELYDPSGGLVTRIDADDLRIYPHVRTTTRFDFGTLNAQAYQAVVVADAGGSDVFGTRYDLDTTH